MVARKNLLLTSGLPSDSLSNNGKSFNVKLMKTMNNSQSSSPVSHLAEPYTNGKRRLKAGTGDMFSEYEIVLIPADYNKLCRYMHLWATAA